MKLTLALCIIPALVFPGASQTMTLFYVIASYLALGALAGTVAGLFGIGGGLIIVPVLMFSFAYSVSAARIAVTAFRRAQQTFAIVLKRQSMPFSHRITTVQNDRMACVRY